MEMSLIELESELAAALPTRNLMCRRRARRHHSGSNNGTSANNGSVANSNSTSQSISNPQTAIATGINSGPAGLQANGALVAQIGANNNSNTNTQFGAPVNFQG